MSSLIAPPVNPNRDVITKAIRKSTWTCRLPPELLSLVCEVLTRDHAQATLTNLQSTSSALYTATTPFIYRHIQINQHQAIKLFGLFTTFPSIENRRFFEPVPPETHLVDLHIAHRLRSFFANTQSLSLFLEGEANLDPETRKHLDRYEDLMVGLSAFDGPNLWPLLDRCQLDMRPWPDNAYDYDIEPLPPVDYTSLIGAVFARQCPRYLSIVPPNPESLDADGDIPVTWAGCTAQLKADNIELIGYFPEDQFFAIPQATSTLTVCYNLREVDGIMAPDSYDLVGRLRPIILDYAGLVQIYRLKLVGSLHRHDHSDPDDPSLHRNYTDTEAFNEISRLVSDLMEHRLLHGNRTDLKIAIVPDTSLESEDAAAWRTYKQPEEQWVSRSSSPSHVGVNTDIIRYSNGSSGLYDWGADGYTGGPIFWIGPG